MTRTAQQRHADAARLALWRVELADTEQNTCDVIVSARTAGGAGRRAAAEVNAYAGRGWTGGPWRVNPDNRDAVVPIELAPARVHAVVPGWE